MEQLSTWRSGIISSIATKMTKANYAGRHSICWSMQEDARLWALSALALGTAVF